MILIGHSIAKNEHQGIPISSTYAKIEFQSFKRSILNSTTRSTPASADQRLSDPGAGEPYIDIAPVAVIRAQGHANGPTIKLPSGTPQGRRDRELGEQAPSAHRRRPKDSDRGILTTASLSKSLCGQRGILSATALHPRDGTTAGLAAKHCTCPSGPTLLSNGWTTSMDYV